MYQTDGKHQTAFRWICHPLDNNNIPLMMKSGHFQIDRR